jgi:hypothetical protein
MLTVCGCTGVARANREHPVKVHSLHAEVYLHTNTRLDCVSSRIPSVVYHICSYEGSTWWPPLYRTLPNFVPGVENERVTARSVCVHPRILNVFRLNVVHIEFWFLIDTYRVSTPNNFHETEMEIHRLSQKRKAMKITYKLLRFVTLI